MKNIVQYFGLIVLICLSFMYTDKVMEVINEKDSLMIEIEEKSNNYKIDKIEGIIDKNTIIPGINGKEVNTNESYNAMKEIGAFSEKYLVYYTTYPDILLKNNYDKYIISGNSNKREVSLVFIVKNITNLDEFIDIVNDYKIMVTLFIDDKLLFDNMDDFNNKFFELNSYGNNNYYTHENILISSNYIKSKTNQDIKYCYTEVENINILEICSKEKLFTIKPYPSYINNSYITIKSNLKSGNIINLNLNNNTIMELPLIINFIKGKGLKIVPLSDLLSEELE